MSEVREIVFSIAGATVLAWAGAIGAIYWVWHNPSQPLDWLALVLTFLIAVAYGAYCWSLIDSWPEDEED